MRDFPEIDQEAERRAIQTLFFAESEFEGKIGRVSVANYLVFLSLRGSELEAEVAKLRQALSVPSPAHLERDLTFLLRARNWRFHNIACVALASRSNSAELLAELWSCLRFGSWTSPQLAATAAYVDPDFVQRAGALVEDDSTYYKSIVALAALLETHPTKPMLTSIAEANIAEAKQFDRDNSGAIAVNWHSNLRAAFSAA